MTRCTDDSMTRLPAMTRPSTPSYSPPGTMVSSVASARPLPGTITSGIGFFCPHLFARRASSGIELRIGAASALGGAPVLALLLLTSTILGIAGRFAAGWPHALGDVFQGFGSLLVFRLHGYIAE